MLEVKLYARNRGQNSSLCIQSYKALTIFFLQIMKNKGNCHFYDKWLTGKQDKLIHYVDK